VLIFVYSLGFVHEVVECLLGGEDCECDLLVGDNERCTDGEGSFGFALGSTNRGTGGRKGFLRTRSAELVML